MEDSSPLEPPPMGCSSLTLPIQGARPCHPECGVVGQLRAALTYPDLPHRALAAVMTLEYLRVIVVVYCSALLPLLIVPRLHWRGLLPGWSIPAYVGSFLLCAWVGSFVHLWLAGG